MAHVYLVGFPGTGKITIGKQLAERVGLPFCDADAALVAQQGVTLHALYDDHDQEAFYTLQHENLRTLSQGEAHVIAVGDCAPLRDADWELIASTGRSAYIKRPAERLYWRLRYDRLLPIWEGAAEEARAQKIEEMLAAREPGYMRAQQIIECMHEEVWEIAQAIAQGLG